MFNSGNSSSITSMEDIARELQSMQSTAGKGAATSNLSALDFWLISDAGFEPLGLVLGNSVFSMGITGGIATAFKGLQRGELTALTQLMYSSRELSLQRMKAEADALGADSIVNVQIEIIHRSEEIMEVVATGTAVKRTGNRSERPITLQVSK